MNWKTRILYGFLFAFDIVKIFFLIYLSFMSIVGTRLCWEIHTPIIGYFVFLMFALVLENCAIVLEESFIKDGMKEVAYNQIMFSFGLRCVESLAILLLLVSEFSLSPEESFCGADELQCFFSVFQKSR